MCSCFDLSGRVISRLDYKVSVAGLIPGSVAAEIATSNPGLGDYLTGHCLQ